MTTKGFETYVRLKQQVTDRGPWQQTASGNAFFLADPRVEEVRFEDISMSLAHQPRYNGHYKDFMPLYTVAEHAARIARWMWEDGCTAQECYAGLHHDSAEAYTGDIVSQIKYCVPELRPFMHRIEVVVNEGLGFEMTEELEHLTKEYDFIALATEQRDLLPKNLTKYSWGDLPAPRSEKIHPWGVEKAYTSFVDFHYGLLEVMKDG
jgi:hypothetical protein